MVVATTIAAAITMVGRIFFISSLYGRREQREGNLLGALLMMVVTPIAAMFVQLGISRTREYAADEGGAGLSGKPLALAKALRKIDASIRQRPMSPVQNNPSISSLYIVNPFKGSTLVELLSTHPPVNKRVARLEHLAHRARLGQYAER